MRENTDQKNNEYEHFSRSACFHTQCSEIRACVTLLLYSVRPRVFLYVLAVYHNVIVVNFLAFTPAGIYLFKANNRSTGTVFEIGSKLKTKNTEQHLVSLLLIYASRCATFLKRDSNTGVSLRILRNF